MNIPITEHFNMFVDKRVEQVDLTLDDDKNYQKALNTLDKTLENPVDVALEAIIIAEKSAYKQGFIDGLSIMAGLSA